MQVCISLKAGRLVVQPTTHGRIEVANLIELQFLVGISVSVTLDKQMVESGLIACYANHRFPRALVAGVLTAGLAFNLRTGENCCSPPAAYHRRSTAPRCGQSPCATFLAVLE
jgi:hypothetical protein